MLHALPARGGPDQRRAGRGPSRHRGRLRRRGPGLQRGPAGPAVRRRRRQPAQRAARARSAGSARRSSSPTSSSAGRPATAIPSRTRSRPAPRTWRASWRSWTRRVVVTLGRFSLQTFMPGARIGGAHGTLRPVDPATGAPDALTYRHVPPGGGVPPGSAASRRCSRTCAGCPMRCSSAPRRAGRPQPARRRRPAATSAEAAGRPSPDGGDRPLELAAITAQEPMDPILDDQMRF